MSWPKKREASTELLQRLQGYMEKQNVDFIGSDFNMSALSTVGDVFSDPEFSAPGNSFLWGLGALEEPRDPVRQGEGDAARQHHMSPPRSDKLSDCE